MQVEIKLDPNCEQTRVVVVTAQVDEQIYDLVQQLSQQSPAILSGFRGEEAEIWTRPSFCECMPRTGR